MRRPAPAATVAPDLLDRAAAAAADGTPLAPLVGELAAAVKALIAVHPSGQPVLDDGEHWGELRGKTISIVHYATSITPGVQIQRFRFDDYPGLEVDFYLACQYGGEGSYFEIARRFRFADAEYDHWELPLAAWRAALEGRPQ